jgi:hypothetical protein
METPGSRRRTPRSGRPRRVRHPAPAAMPAGRRRAAPETPASARPSHRSRAATAPALPSHPRRRCRPSPPARCRPPPPRAPPPPPRGGVPVQARFHPRLRGDKNRRDVGKSQPKWTAPTLETPGSPAEHRRAAPTAAAPSARASAGPARARPPAPRRAAGGASWAAAWEGAAGAALPAAAACARPRCTCSDARPHAPYRQGGGILGELRYAGQPSSPSVVRTREDRLQSRRARYSSSAPVSSSAGAVHCTHAVVA